MKRFNQKENIIYYGKIISETPTDIADAQGHTCIQLLNKKKLMELKRNIKREEHRNKIGYIHIGAIQVLIKATFQNYKEWVLSELCKNLQESKNHLCERCVPTKAEAMEPVSSWRG